jgi:ubiquinone/menaquinone biosynthesis C-methylase UbiE
MNKPNSKSIEEVRDFWENNPLFQDEGNFQLGTKKWFDEWEKVAMTDCYAGQGTDEIFKKGLKKENRILDVGCGPGFWVRYFLSNGFNKISACDLTSKAVELTKKSLELFNIKGNPDVRIGNAEQLPWQDQTFDHINCQGVIHHTPRTHKCIQEFYRVLKPEGTLCFSVYYKLFLLRHPLLLRMLCFVLWRFITMPGRGREYILKSGKAEEIIRLYDGWDNPIGKAYTKEEIYEICKGLFEIAEFKRFFFPARALPLKLPKPLHRWLHNHFGLMIIIRAKKIT